MDEKTRIPCSAAELYEAVEKTKSLENYDDSKIKASLAALMAAVGYTRKNLLKTTASSLTKNGITFTVNADGSVTANGTATAKTDFVSFIGAPAEAMYYTKLKLSGCPLNGSAETYRMFIQDLTSGYATLGVDTGNGASVTINRSVTQMRCFITIYEGYTAENLTFYPMLRYEDIADGTYEPYKPSVEERLAALESALSSAQPAETSNVINMEETI